MRTALILRWELRSRFLLVLSRRRIPRLCLHLLRLSTLCRRRRSLCRRRAARKRLRKKAKTWRQSAIQRGPHARHPRSASAHARFASLRFVRRLLGSINLNLGSQANLAVQGVQPAASGVPASSAPNGGGGATGVGGGGGGGTAGPLGGAVATTPSSTASSKPPAPAPKISAEEARELEKILGDRVE